MQKPNRSRSAKNDKIVHLSPVSSDGQPMSRLGKRYGELERTELLPEVLGYSLYGLLALLIVGVIWAFFANVEVVASAPGRLIPSGHVKMIQPDIDGVVESIPVKEGDKVKAGAVLAVLEPARSKDEVEKRDAEATIARQQLVGMQSAKLALEAAIANPAVTPLDQADIEGSAQVVSDLNTAYVHLREAELDSRILSAMGSERTALTTQTLSLAEQKVLHQNALQERASERLSQLAQKRIEIDQLKQSLLSAKTELSQAQAIFTATTQQEESFRQVFQAGAVSRVDYLNIVKEVERARRDVTRQESIIQELSKKIAIGENQLVEMNAGDRASTFEKKAHIKDLDVQLGKVGVSSRELQRKHTLASASFQAARSRAKALLQKISLNVAEKQQKLRESEAHLRIAGIDYSATQIKSPVSGTVTGIRLRGKGHVVKRGERLMSVVPDDAPLAFEASVANKDAGFIEAGQDAKIKLTAYPFEDFGVLNGKVSHIEATSESIANPVFVAKIVPESQSIMVRGEKRPLVSGMTATCEIVTRKKTVLNILFEPLKRMQETKWN